MPWTRQAGGKTSELRGCDGTEADAVRPLSFATQPQCPDKPVDPRPVEPVLAQAVAQTVAPVRDRFDQLCVFSSSLVFAAT